MTKGMILTQFLFIEPCSSMVLLMMLDLIPFTEGIMGMAIVGGAALALGGLVSLGIALAKK